MTGPFGNKIESESGYYLKDKYIGTVAQVEKDGTPRPFLIMNASFNQLIH